MLLGHHYLVAPSMTIAPLTRSLDLIATGLAARCVLAGIGAWSAHAAAAGTTWSGQPEDATFLAMRWGMGIVGAAVSVYLARRTAAIRSTQSATGILYITTIFVLFGELASLDDGRARVDRLILLPLRCGIGRFSAQAAFSHGGIDYNRRATRLGPCLRTGYHAGDSGDGRGRWS